MKSLPRSLEDPPPLAGAGTACPGGGNYGFFSFKTTSSSCRTFSCAVSCTRRCSARRALTICRRAAEDASDGGREGGAGRDDAASIGTNGGMSLRSGSRGDAMTPEGRDDADDDGADALRDDDDDDDAGSDGAHLSLTSAASPGFAASRAFAASIPAICASRRPFGADPRLAFPLAEGFDGTFEDRCCRPCGGSAEV